MSTEHAHESQPIRSADATEPTSGTDLMAEIGAAVTRGREGAEDTARRELTEIWERIAETDDFFHRCVLAHYLADLHEPADALVWNARAPAAADLADDPR